MGLNKAEFLIALVFEDLSEERHVMILLQVGLDPINDGNCPLYDQVLKTILLVQVGVHVLLHGLPGLLKSLALLIEFDLLAVDIINNVFKLLQSQNPRGCNA